MQAVILKTATTSLLLTNTYFPVDPKTVTFDDRELMETLETIKDIMNKNEFNDLCLAGDINCDFLRKSGHVQAVKDFTDILCLVSSWDRFEIDFTHSSEVNNISFTSKIDHFFWSKATAAKVIDAGVIHLPCNLSDHNPLMRR